MHILIVEDDAAIRELLSECLAEEGYGVVGVEHGRAALEALRCQRPLPDLILLDVTMPVMNGWQFLDAQQQDALLAGIPVLLLTAAGDTPSDHHRYAHVQRAAKPIVFDVLLALVAGYRELRKPRELSP